jgi:hypothetical protein
VEVCCLLAQRLNLCLQLPCIITGHIMVEEAPRNTVLADYTPVDVKPRTGKPSYDKVVIEGRPLVLYEYPLLRSPQIEPADLARTVVSGALRNLASLRIMVVHSEALPTLLKPSAVSGQGPSYRRVYDSECIG